MGASVARGDRNPAAPIAAPGLRDVTLDDRYEALSGTVLLSGIQAIARIPLDQRRLDVARGLNTAGFISGYQGSPLGGLDLELARIHRFLDPAHIIFRPAINEELAATAVNGTQLLRTLPGRRYEGVTGYWYGKNPGLDRAADAIRHGNITGTAPLGGAVALIGDDPASKSSTVPSACEAMCRSLMVPLLAPGSVADLLALGLHAVALSRHAGTWCGLKVVADIADASAVLALEDPSTLIPDFAIREVGDPPVLLAPTNLDAEFDLMTARLERATSYARLAGLNRVTIASSHPRLTVVASGIGHQAVLRALADLGLDAHVCDEVGLQLVELRMPWPLDRGEVRGLVAGAETVLVVEDKLPFLEGLIKEALYGAPHTPRVIGQLDADGRPLLPVRGVIDADDVVRALVRTLPSAALGEQARARVAELDAAATTLRSAIALPVRTPAFCSGCPHSTSTRAKPDELVGLGIGCHILVAVESGDRRGDFVGMPQMGGEGAQWLGLAPFTDDEHFIQNLGDGTFHHSGSLAIRAAIAAGVDMTYRLLNNDAVAMTGGQQPEGGMDVPTLTRWLALEGVSRVIVTTPEPERYHGIELDPIATVRPREELGAAQDELTAIKGVTVLIHDDRCATEKRRMRKRGTLPAPAEHVWINERVCEGCGDCGEKSTCLSVVPVTSEFGAKTRIDRSSCNEDLTCVQGDCPSFVMVTPSSDAPARRSPPAAPAVPEPIMRVGRDVLVRMPGVGGSGVVTISQILQMAAHLDGRWSAGVEQTGVAQKGGAVVSDVRIADRPVTGQVRGGIAAADVLLGLDMLEAARPATLAHASPMRTVAVVSTVAAPTAAMITDRTVQGPTARRAQARIQERTRPGENLHIDTHALADRLFGDGIAANMILVGAAFQHGCIPLSSQAVERAIVLNGAAAEMNVAAFRWGRAAAAGLAPQPAPSPPKPDPVAENIVEEAEVHGELRRLLSVRVPELIAYQDEAYARSYVADVLRVAAIECIRLGSGSTSVTEAYAQGRFKLLAYKDEYEVARLHLDAAERARRDDAFGPGARVHILLHPPLLRAMGLKRKLRLGPWVLPALRGLHAARRVRGTRWDPFGFARVRRVERALPAEYEALVDEALAGLDATTAAHAVAVAELPALIVGFEDIKLRNVEKFRRRAAELRAQPTSLVTVHPPTPSGSPTLSRAG